MDEDALWRLYVERLLEMDRVLVDLPTQAKLALLSTAWLAIASHARNAALAAPGGFPAERTRQVEDLDDMVRLVAAATPDLEAERLYQEGEYDGLLRHVQQRLEEAKRAAEKANREAESDPDYWLRRQRLEEAKRAIEDARRQAEGEEPRD